MTEQEKDAMRQHNGETINQLCKLQEKDAMRQHNGETINQLCKLGDEILAAYLPKDWTKERWVRAMAEHRGEGE